MLAAAIVTAAVPVVAQAPEDRLDRVQSEINELNRQIKDQKQIKDQRAAEVAAVAARLEELQAQVAAAQARVDAKEADIAAKEAELVELQSRLDVLEVEIAETRIEIHQTKDLVRERAVDLYMTRSLNVGGVLLAVNEMADVSVGLEYAGHVIEDSEVLIRRLEVLEQQVELQQQEVAERRAREQEVLGILEIEREELIEDRAELEAAEAEVATELESARALLAAVQADIEEIEGELTALEKEQASIEAEIRARQQAGGEKVGRLRWPVSGSVSSGFGYRIHPISGVRKLHTGIDISAGSGTPIVAAASGTVILAQWYGGYGNAVVIDHGGGLATLYAHQSSMAVGVGQAVADGQVIGYVGSTGYSTGPHLHFETRENGTPVNPMSYLNG
jgi:murein DD-endopeptidase MepM/ murein hydrolase activator NlpD